MGRSHVTEETVARMHQMRAAGGTYEGIADELGIGGSTVWRHLNGVRQGTHTGLASTTRWHRVSDVSADSRVGRCSICGPDVELYLRHRRGRQEWICHKGLRALKRRYSSANRARRALGVTPIDYDAMLVAQGGVCAICDGVDTDGRSLAVDHCHTTGRVRGLLCGPCNLALGLMKDDPERMLRAINYLG